jgi:hypothetical protein
MTGDDSRKLKVGTRVSWASNETDQGTLVETDWSAVKIKWDSGLSNSIHHNDMGGVTVASTKA